MHGPVNTLKKLLQLFPFFFFKLIKFWALDPKGYCPFYMAYIILAC